MGDQQKKPASSVVESGRKEVNEDECCYRG